MQRRAFPTTRYVIARRPTARDGYPQRIAMWDAVKRLGSANRSELLRELQRVGYTRSNGAPVDEGYCRTELTDMTKRGFLRRLDEVSHEPSKDASAKNDTVGLGDGVKASVTMISRAPTAGYFKGGSIDSRIKDAIVQLGPALLRRSGSVFYSGRSAFKNSRRLYVLGLNPGGDPVQQAAETVAADLLQFEEQPENWSAYRDESWSGQPAGTHGLQPQVLHLFASLSLSPEKVPASNVVFVRSRGEAELKNEKSSLLRQCWPIHQAVIDALGVDTVLCFGTTAGKWVREMLGADEPLASFVECNARGWTSSAHRTPEGKCVITATHPSRANWRNPESDPTPLVRQMLAR